VCSIHYPEISDIVQQVAKRHGIPYNEHLTFRAAVASHWRMLKRLGSPETSAA
jgi:linoleoyl-CoA desaturase